MLEKNLRRVQREREGDCGQPGSHQLPRYGGNPGSRTHRKKERSKAPMQDGVEENQVNMSYNIERDNLAKAEHSELISPCPDWGADGAPPNHLQVSIKRLKAMSFIVISV